MADEPEPEPATTTDPTPEPQAPPDDWRFQRLEQQIQGVAAAVAASAPRPAPPPPRPPAGDDVSDDELFSRAQQGDRRAYEVWTERRARHVVNQSMTQLRHEGLVDQQLGQLSQQYPVFQDVNHPLTTAVRNKYSLMMGEGYANTKATLLAAMEKTIASNPQLTAQLYGGPRAAADQQRRASTASATAGHFAPAHRSQASRGVPSRVRESSPEELALAKRMGIRDPKGAKERFLRRQESGQSSLGAVSNFVKEEDL